jgi:chromosome segregation ATPase
MKEQFNATILTILKSINLINQISEREALITNFKSEIKSLKATIANYKEKINNIEIEKNIENEKKEENEINNEINEIDLIYNKLILKMNEMANITELNQSNNNLLSDNNNYKLQINLINDMNEKLKQKIIELEKENKNIKLQYSNNNEINEKEAKSYKNEIKGLMEELIKIKETWVPADKKKNLFQLLKPWKKIINY